MAPPRDEPLLTSRQAAERLGVKLETLYAYVARGLLRGEPSARDRAKGPAARRYARREIESFLSKRRWSRRVVASAVSSTDGGRLLYRGQDAVVLAGRASFEQVAALLWTAAPGEAAPWPAVPRDAIGEAVRAAKAVPAAGPLVQAQILVAALGTRDGTSGDLAAETVTATGKRLMTRLVAGLAAARGGDVARASRGPLAARVLAALGGQGDDASVHLVDRALVLSAEHELNASTFAARVAASTGADLHAVVGAGIATLSGPRHGGMTDRVEAAFRACPPVVEEVAMAFGHPLYPSGDPRTPPLLAAARGRGTGESRRALDAMFALLDARDPRRDPAPTVDVGLAATAMALGLAPGLASTLFAIGRTAGWIAHAIEQYGIGELIRPRARYTGPLPGDDG
ncbi:MAG TPA: citrate synthase [Polyangiaceae bacterium]